MENIDVKTGLTEDEREIVDHLIAAFAGMSKLPHFSPADLSTIIAAFCALQNLMGVRVLARDYPDFWRSH